MNNIKVTEIKYYNILMQNNLKQLNIFIPLNFKQILSLFPSYPTISNSARVF